MKIDVTVPLKEFDGSDLTTQSRPVGLCADCTRKLREARETLTLRLVCTRSLTALTEKTAKRSTREKFDRGQLAHKIYNNDEPVLISEEIVMLKEAIGEYEGPLVIFQAHGHLEPTD